MATRTPSRGRAVAGRGGPEKKIGKAHEPPSPVIFNEVQQHVTHKQILEIGGHVVDDLMERKRKEQQEAVKVGVQQENEAARERLREALESAQHAAQKDMVALTRQLEAKQTDAVADERKKTTTEMEERAKNLLAEARQEAARSQEEAIANCQEIAREEQERAVECARREERESAARQAHLETENTTAHLEATVAACEQAKAKALAKLNAAMLEEKEEAIKATLAAADERKQEEMAEQALRFNDRETELQTSLANQVSACEKAEENFRETDVKLQVLQAKYDDLMTEYKHFVDTVPKLSSGFLL